MGQALLTDSRARTFSRCRRLHLIKYERGCRPVLDAYALRFGSLLHGGLEAWWKASGDRLAGAFAAVQSQAAKFKADAYDVEKARAMLLGYDARWKSEPLETLAVEAQFEAPLVHPSTGEVSPWWRLGGKVDAVVRHTGTGQVLLVEHKSSSDDIRPGSPYWSKLRLNSQISTYFAGAKALGFEVEGCLYDVLGKPQLRPLKKNTKRAADETPAEYFDRVCEAIAESPAEYFQRQTVVRLEQELADAALDVWDIGAEMIGAQVSGRAPRNPDACFQWGRPCDFFTVCSGEESLDDTSKFRRAEQVHEELVPERADA